jgi:hypothetical protein
MMQVLQMIVYTPVSGTGTAARLAALSEAPSAEEPFQTEDGWWWPWENDFMLDSTGHSRNPVEPLLSCTVWQKVSLPGVLFSAF